MSDLIELTASIVFVLVIMGIVLKLLGNFWERQANKMLSFIEVEEYDDQSRKFWNERASWSLATFGLVKDRGPKGCILHLQKEVVEILSGMESGEDWDKIAEEIIDARFLIEDAAMRHGLTYDSYNEVSFRKLAKNKLRKWGKPSGDRPVEHIRGEHD